MICHLIAVGNRMPAWITAGFNDYTSRLPKHFQLVLHEIPLQKRTKNSDLARLIQQEGRQMLAAVPANTISIALDVQGRLLTTEQFSQQLERFYQASQDLAIFIGGPEGLAPECLQRASARWSLSALTFPHALVRVILAEQFYRAWSIISGHPYHRE